MTTEEPKYIDGRRVVAKCPVCGKEIEPWEGYGEWRTLSEREREVIHATHKVDEASD